jgi:hypothetical protein
LNKSKSSKLLEYKGWLNLPEVAKYLSGVCEEEVSEADILRFALNGRLKLSVYFIEKIYLRPYIERSLDNDYRLHLEDRLIARNGFPTIFDS